MERTTLSTITQIAPESTPGGTVAADTLLQTMTLTPQIEVDVNEFRERGIKYPSLAVPTRDFITGTYEGKGSYSEMVYPLAAVMGTPVITTPVGGTATRQWAFLSEPLIPDTPVTFTVEQGSKDAAGSTIFAHQITYVLFTSWTMEFEARGEVNISGDFIGSRLEFSGITLTPGAAVAQALAPIIENQIDVYADDTAATIGNTKLIRVLKGSISVSNRWDYLWTVNSTIQGPTTHLEIEPTTEVQLTVEADAAGMAFLTQMRTAGLTRFFQIYCTGQTTGEGALVHKFIFSFAGKVVGFSEFKDEKGVYAIDVTLRCVYNSGWGKAFEATFVNRVLAL